MADLTPDEVNELISSMSWMDQAELWYDRYVVQVQRATDAESRVTALEAVVELVAICLNNSQCRFCAGYDDRHRPGCLVLRAVELMEGE